ncbi:MAG TPA: hypothetical protein VII98_09005 [Solirubrobacteraceae bacterium]
MSTDHARDPRREPLERLDALEDELATLVATLREGAGRLRDEIARVRASVEALPGAPAPPPPAVADTGDAEGARLVALDLVLSGTPRDAAVLRLAAEFPGVDAAALLDEAGATSGV